MTHDVEGFSIDRDRERILYSVNEGGYTRLHGLTADRFRPLRLPELRGRRPRLGRLAPPCNGTFTTLRAETAKSPTSAYVYEWKTRELVRWHTPSAPEVDTTHLRRLRPGVLPRPRRDPDPHVRPPPRGLRHGRDPVPRGGQLPRRPRGPVASRASRPSPSSTSTPGSSTSSPTCAAATGYGKAWLHADDGPKRLDVITDIEDAATYIRANWGRNGVAPKIGVAGGSYGGYSALMAMSRFAGAYDAGVSVVGMSNLLTFLENTAPYRRALRITEYGDPEKDRDALIALSPSTYVDQVKAPLLIIQGANDPRVPVGEAIQIHDQLKSTRDRRPPDRLRRRGPRVGQAGEPGAGDGSHAGVLHPPPEVDPLKGQGAVRAPGFARDLVHGGRGERSGAPPSRVAAPASPPLTPAPRPPSKCVHQRTKTGGFLHTLRRQAPARRACPTKAGSRAAKPAANP